MDPKFHGFSGSMSGGFQFGNQSVNVFPDEKQINGSRFENDFPSQATVNAGGELHTNGLDQCFGFPSTIVSSSCASGEEELQEDCDLSDTILGYISQVLMEEDMEDQTCMLHESLGLQAAEKSFYDVLGKKYPPSPEQELTFIDHYIERPNDHFSQYPYASARSVMSFSGSGSPIRSSNSSNNGFNGLVDYPFSHVEVTNTYEENQLLWQFRKGVEEANKFLPNGNKLLLGLLPQDLVRDTKEVGETDGKKKEREFSSTQTRGRKNPFREDDVDQAEERTSKQPAFFPDPTLRSNEFDLILLNSMGDGEAKLHENIAILQNEAKKKNREPKVVSKGKGRGKKMTKKKEVIDLRTLLLNCAQAIAACCLMCMHGTSKVLDGL